MIKSNITNFILSILSVCALMGQISANEGMIIGGYQRVNEKSEAVLEAAQYAFAAAFERGESVEPIPFVSESSDPDDYDLKVLNAYQQVVAGINIKMTIGVFQNEVCLGGFIVIVYNKFGDISVAKWGKIFTESEMNAMFNGIDGSE